MKSYGEIEEVMFRRIKWCVYNLAFEYKLMKYDTNKLVYVDSMKELRREIAGFINDDHYQY